VTPPRKVVVVGGGIVGLSTAWSLMQLGMSITLVEARKVGSGATYANGGWLCPAQAGPLPEPGLTRYALKSLTDRDSSLYITPAELLRSAGWFLRFRHYCNGASYATGLEAIARLGADTFSHAETWRAAGVEFEMYQQGMVYASKDPAKAAEALRKLEPMRRFGYEIPSDLLTGGDLHEFEPSLSEEISAGFHIGQHWHVRPDSLASGLLSALASGGAEIHEGTEVAGVRGGAGGRIEAVRTHQGELTGTDFVFTTGSWPVPIDRKTQARIPVKAGKGYSFAVQPTIMPKHAILLTDVHVGCTPFDGFMRIGGTMEFSGLNRDIDQRRVDAIIRGAKTCFQPWADPNVSKVWSGPRPLTPDGLPVIDAIPGFSNAYVSTGHAMQGVSLAASSGNLLAQFIASGRRPALIEPFGADRFGTSIGARVGLAS
jgi:D-amino-acid dehydrogenase